MPDKLIHVENEKSLSVWTIYYFNNLFNKETI